MSCVLVNLFRVRRGVSLSRETSSQLVWVSIDETLDADAVRDSGLDPRERSGSNKAMVAGDQARMDVRGRDEDRRDA